MQVSELTKGTKIEMTFGAMHPWATMIVTGQENGVAEAVDIETGDKYTITRDSDDTMAVGNWWVAE